MELVSLQVILGEMVLGRPPSALLKTAERAELGYTALPLRGTGCPLWLMPLRPARRYLGPCLQETVVQAGVPLVWVWEEAMQAGRVMSTNAAASASALGSRPKPQCSAQWEADGKGSRGGKGRWTETEKDGQSDRQVHG